MSLKSISIKRGRSIALLAIVVAGVAFLSYRLSRIEKDMVAVPGGTLYTVDPVSKANKAVQLQEFLIDRNLVTVADYEEFVKATGYKTEAEKFGNAAVFNDIEKQWTLEDGADFRFPQGKNRPHAELSHPVTQISWHDATAYATWKGKRLPTQWEWEQAARSGEQSDDQYSWGTDLVVNGKYKANTWQGSFPAYNTVEDGYAYTSPVGAFGKNKLGLTDMGGNVWQWCQDDIEPTDTVRAADPAMRKVLRGGSFLCDPQVCHGFQVMGRSSSTAESSLMHAGFRCAKDIEQ
jgi:sulfatase modifying factor 1